MSHSLALDMDLLTAAFELKVLVSFTITFISAGAAAHNELEWERDWGS